LIKSKKIRIDFVSNNLVKNINDEFTEVKSKNGNKNKNKRLKEEEEKTKKRY